MFDVAEIKDGWAHVRFSEFLREHACGIGWLSVGLLSDPESADAKISAMHEDDPKLKLYHGIFHAQFNNDYGTKRDRQTESRGYRLLDGCDSATAEFLGVHSKRNCPVSSDKKQAVADFDKAVELKPGICPTSGSGPVELLSDDRRSAAASDMDDALVAGIA